MIDVSTEPTIFRPSKPTNKQQVDHSIMAQTTAHTSVIYRLRPRRPLQYNATDPCAICKEDHGTDETKMRKLKQCGHVFHSMCINGWLEQTEGQCPLCRTFNMEDVSLLQDTDKTSDYEDDEDNSYEDEEKLVKRRNPRKKRKLMSSCSENSSCSSPYKRRRQGSYEIVNHPFMTSQQDVNNYFQMCIETCNQYQKQKAFGKVFTWTLNPYLWKEYLRAEEEVHILSYSAMGIIYKCKFCQRVHWNNNVTSQPTCQCQQFSNFVIGAPMIILERQTSDMSVNTTRSTHQRHKNLQECISIDEVSTERNIQVQQSQIIDTNLPQIMYVNSTVIGSQDICQFAQHIQIQMLCPFYSIVKCKLCNIFISASSKDKFAIQKHACFQR